MSILRRVEKRSWTAEPVIPTNSQAGVLSISGVPVTADSVLRIATVYGCVRIITESVSSTPVYVYQQNGKIKKRVEDAALNDRLNNLFVDLNGDPVPLWNGIHRLVTSLAIRGNAFAAVVERAGKYPTGITVLHPDDVQIKLSVMVRGLRVGNGKLAASLFRPKI